MRPADVPALALAVRTQHERTLARAHQYPYAAHRHSLPARPDTADPPGPAPGMIPPDPAPSIDTGLSRPPDSQTIAGPETHRPAVRSLAGHAPMHSPR